PPPPQARGSQRPAKPEPEEFFSCVSCGKVSAQPRYIVFEQVHGWPFHSVREPVHGVFCPTCAEQTAVRASLHTWLRGWWGVPMGPVYAIAAIVRNVAGGHHPEDTNARVLIHQARAFLTRGQVDVARAIAEQAKRFASSPDTARQVSSLIAALSDRPLRRLKGRWAGMWRGSLIQLAPLAGVMALFIGVNFVLDRATVPDGSAEAPPPPVAHGPTALPPGVYHVAVPRLNVRKGPGLDQPTIETLDRFTAVQVLNAKPATGQWVRIATPGGGLGYVDAVYLADGNGAAPKRQWCEDNKGDPVVNGALLTPPPGGANRLVIRNTTAEDVLVKLKGDGDQSLLGLYVQAGAVAQSAGIPDGTYQVLVATGSNFSRGCGVFLHEMRTVAYPEKRTFQPKTEGDQPTGSTVALTLRPPGTPYTPAQVVPPTRFAQ
ncbi:MAG: SH3 domain-containing protein, partial [Alphaproteobacteria bacterium]|nr:SH3 domain-containing protein [Alphaproteobacteria bacterium]